MVFFAATVILLFDDMLYQGLASRGRSLASKLAARVLKDARPAFAGEHERPSGAGSLRREAWCPPWGLQARPSAASRQPLALAPLRWIYYFFGRENASI
jgi:hypothetical protein